MMDLGDAGDARDVGVAMSQTDSEAASNEMLDDGCTVGWLFSRDALLAMKAWVTK